MNTMIAFCGLNCSVCEAYLATQANDEAAKERFAAKLRQEYNAPGITAADVTCDGCTAFDGRLGSYCFECDIRACGIDHQVTNCAHCADYDACAKLTPAAKATLDEIRRTL